MSADAAYALTKAYWTQKDEMGRNAAWWNGVDATLMANIDGAIHPGAVRYYEEAGVTLTDAQR